MADFAPFLPRSVFPQSLNVSFTNRHSFDAFTEQRETEERRRRRGRCLGTGRRLTVSYRGFSKPQFVSAPVRFGFVLLIKKIRRCGGSSSSPARRRRLSFRVPLLLCTRHYRLPLRTECTDLINPTCFCLHPLSEPPGLTLGLVYRRVLPVSSGLWTSRSRRWPSARPRAAAARHVLVQYNG